MSRFLIIHYSFCITRLKCARTATSSSGLIYSNQQSTIHNINKSDKSSAHKCQCLEKWKRKIVGQRNSPKWSHIISRKSVDFSSNSNSLIEFELFVASLASTSNDDAYCDNIEFKWTRNSAKQNYLKWSSDEWKKEKNWIEQRLRKTMNEVRYLYEIRFVFLSSWEHTLNCINLSNFRYTPACSP